MRNQGLGHEGNDAMSSHQSMESPRRNPWLLAAAVALEVGWIAVLATLAIVR
jgi:hypothetical protein